MILSIYMIKLHKYSVYDSHLSEVGFVIDHLMLDVVDRVDDILACRILLGQKWHRTMSVP